MAFKEERGHAGWWCGASGTPHVSLVVVAERLGITEILTVDRADFDVYRLSGNRRFVQVLAA